MHTKSIKELSALLQSKAISATELATHFLDRIEASDLNAFLHVDRALTLAQAAEADARIAAGTATPLTGVPIAHKDIFVTRDWRATAGSKMLANYVSPFDATVVEKFRAAGVVTLGKLNCDEFAMGAANENSAFGAVKNYADETRVSGGSSGGAAVAVQANMCHAAIGTDTGGSVRQPASFCGLIGLKPTYGRISRHGIIAYASSFDQVGPITRSVEDAALLLEVMAGVDDYDSTLANKPVPAYAGDLKASTGKKKIGYLQEALSSPGVDVEVKGAMATYVEKLRNEGHTVTSISFEDLDYLVP